MTQTNMTTTPEEFTKHMQIIKDSGLPVVTFSPGLLRK